MNNYKLYLSFDGTEFSGWQRLGGNTKTIQKTLEDCIFKMTGKKTEVIGCGRTDAGVHAKKYVANFKTKEAFKPQFIKEYLNRYLPKSINVFDCKEADDRFHSRFSVEKKTYVYRIWNSFEHNVFERKYMYDFCENLDIAAMQNAAKRFLGCHDFLGFSSLKKAKKSTKRTIFFLDINKIGDEIDIVVTGDGFLYNTVRIISGTLLEIGCKQRDAKTIDDVFSKKDRTLAGFTAPAKGLFLKDVFFNE